MAFLLPPAARTAPAESDDGFLSLIVLQMKNNN